jgi:L-seryl-tRNA(Ser) seleniumtransferase
VALHARAEDLADRARALAARLVAAGVPARAVDSTAVVGGGGAPGTTLPSSAVELDAALATPLRTGTPPVLGRVERGVLLLDLRSVQPEDDDALAAAVLGAV